MIAVVNGRVRELPGDTTVADLVAGFGMGGSGRGVAVAVNGEVVARDQWTAVRISDRDRIEVLGAVQGG